MDIKPIRNTADYEAALQEVENCWMPNRARRKATAWMCW